MGRGALLVMYEPANIITFARKLFSCLTVLEGSMSQIALALAGSS